MDTFPHQWINENFLTPVLCCDELPWSWDPFIYLITLFTGSNSKRTGWVESEEIQLEMYRLSLNSLKLFVLNICVCFIHQYSPCWSSFASLHGSLELSFYGGTILQTCHYETDRLPSIYLDHGRITRWRPVYIWHESQGVNTTSVSSVVLAYTYHS